jgi:hypothetical protein
MPTFAVEHDRACARQAKALGRALTGEEIARLEGELLEAWIAAGRLDELIRTLLQRFGRDGGLVEIATLGHHLRATRDAPRVHALFGGLLSRRVKAFHDWWPDAAEGHLGAMQAAARTAAEAMDAYLEYMHCLHALALVDEAEALRAEMLRFQARLPARTVLPPRRGPVAPP